MSNGTTIAVAILLSAGALFGGGWALTALSGHAAVSEAVRQAVGRGEIDEKDARFLNVRFQGYGVEAVAKHWQVLRGNRSAAEAEARFLKLDLAFPFLYGAAFLASLWLLWHALGRPVAAAWLLAPVAAGVLADWIENLAQLRQLARFLRGEALQPGWIAVANAATVSKLVTLSAAGLLILGLAAAAGWSLLRRQ
jgi:hypothetical protein